MIPRLKTARILARLAQFPAVALLGPRQAGKTTLADHIARERPSLYLDLESPADRAKLSDPALYLAGHEDKLVILDEVERMPELFQTLRGLIDRGGRRDLKTGRSPVAGLGIDRPAPAVG
ncbi:MAG: AAA family ATPase [Woeseia sp.]